MIKRNISLVALAITMGLVSCGGNSSNSTTTDSSANNVQMMDSGQNVAPAEGMGDSTLNRTGAGNASTSTANDSVTRVGGGATSNGTAGGSSTASGGSDTGKNKRDTSHKHK